MLARRERRGRHWNHLNLVTRQARKTFTTISYLPLALVNKQLEWTAFARAFVPFDVPSYRVSNRPASYIEQCNCNTYSTVRHKCLTTHQFRYWNWWVPLDTWYINKYKYLDFAHIEQCCRILILGKRRKHSRGRLRAETIPKMVTLCSDIFQNLRVSAAYAGIGRRTTVPQLLCAYVSWNFVLMSGLEYLHDALWSSM